MIYYYLTISIWQIIKLWSCFKFCVRNDNSAIWMYYHYATYPSTKFWHNHWMNICLLTSIFCKPIFLVYVVIVFFLLSTIDSSTIIICFCPGMNLSPHFGILLVFVSILVEWILLRPIISLLRTSSLSTWLLQRNYLL